MIANIYFPTRAEVAAWPKPNYDDPVRRIWIVPYAIVFQLVAIACVVARLYVRLRMRKDTAGIDDVFLTLALVFAIALTACGCLDLLHYGIDRHTWDVRPSVYPHAAMGTWITFVIALCSGCCIKTSVLLLYRRIVAPTYNRAFDIAIWVAIGAIMAFFLTVLLGLCFICDPLWSYWMAWDFNWKTSYQCSDGQWLNYFIGIVSVISDIYAISLPLALLENTELHMTWKQKWTTYFFFLLGISVIAAGVGRTYWLVQLGRQPDTSWTGGNLLIWCVAETQLSIICACAPSIRLIFMSVGRRSLSFTRQYRKKSHASEGSTDNSQNGFVALESTKSTQTIHIGCQPQATTSV
ncbi:hypothetical protein Q7P35_008423 [Cladosporium inversicolor]